MNKSPTIQITKVGNGYIVHFYDAETPDAYAITETGPTNKWMVFVTIGAVQDYIAEKFKGVEQ